MLKSSLFAIFLAASAATPLLAEDWTGFYAGGQIGHLNFKDKTYPSKGVVLPGTTLYQGSGGQLGAFAGYTHDFGQFVVGGEVALNFSSLKPDFAVLPGVSSGRTVKQTTEMKLRVGFDGGAVLPYVVAGQAWQSIGVATGATQNYRGMSYGVGVDYKVTSNIVAGAEFDWYKLKNTAPLSDLKTDSSVLNLRLSYRF